MEEFRIQTKCRRTPQRIPTWSCRLAGCAVLVIGLACPASGQTLGLEASRNTRPAPVEQATDQLGRTTPRGTIAAFIRAVPRDDFVSAAGYMEDSDRHSSQPAVKSRVLNERMHRHCTA